MIHRQIDIALGDRSYSIYVGTGSLSSFGPTCRQHGIPDSVVLISDRNVAYHHLKPLVNDLIHHNFKVTTIVVPPGETQKSLRRANTIFTEMLKKRIPRNSAVIAFGGGVIGDLAGFIASTYQRGVKLVQVPTTLLSQVDSSIGGKVGVNHPLGKNMIGAFYQPSFVWTDVEYLKTLPSREVVCGLGEIVKYGIIRDAGLFALLESQLNKILQLDVDVLMSVQTTCASIKAQVVSEDEKESGVRIILNCGHTIGHALESAGSYRLLKHGEAVLLGIVAESSIANKIGLLDGTSYKRITELVDRVPIRAKLQSLRISEILSAMGRDKKRIGASIRFVLPTKIGEVKVVDNVELKVIQSVVKEVLGKK